MAKVIESTVKEFEAVLAQHTSKKSVRGWVKYALTAILSAGLVLGILWGKQSLEEYKQGLFQQGYQQGLLTVAQELHNGKAIKFDEQTVYRCVGESPAKQ